MFFGGLSKTNLFNITDDITLYVFIVYPLVGFTFTLLCVFAGMSCCRSSSCSWRRQKEALTSSHAATRPSVCSGCPTTPCPLLSGLRLLRPSSSPVTSVSSLRRSVSSWTTCQQCDVQVGSLKLPLSFTAAHLLSAHACSVFKVGPDRCGIF